MSEVSRIEALVAARYDDHLLTLTDAERSREEAAADAANASGYQLSTEWSHRGVVRSLWSFIMRIPVAAPISATPRERTLRFLDDHGAIFGLSSAGSALQVERTGPKDGGGTVVRLKEILRGLPVFGSGLILHVGPEGDIEWLAGLVLPESEVASAAATPALTADMAAAAAGGTALGSELGWFDQEAFGVTMGPPRLSWRVRSALGYEEYDVYVDAATGSELARVSLFRKNEHKEIFYFDGWLPGSIQFDDVCHTSGDAQCPPDWCQYGIYCRDPSSSWQGTSHDIYIGTDNTYDYYMARHGRDSWDNNQCGQPGHPCTNPDYHRMRASSDAPVNGWCPCNAQWRPIDATSAPAQTEFCSTSFSRDVVGHEFTHGVIQSEGDLTTGCSQSGALVEAFPDVFGEFIQHYATGSTDWATMTGISSTCSIWIRDLKDPDGLTNDKPYYCSGCGESSSYVPQPDHWSNYRPECGGHWNSTIISKAGYLLGREPGEGSETHGGVAVTGIGEAKAGKVWYDTLLGLSGADTFTHFRQVFLSQCVSHTSGSDYINCFSSVRAVGLWSVDFAQSWNTDATVDMARWTVGGEERRYIFYKGEGVNALYYRYRTCPFNISCSWSSESSFDAGSSGPSAAVLPGSYMVACFRNGSGSAIYCDKWDSSGTRTTGPDISNTSIVGEPSLVYYNGTLYIAYRKSNNNIYWRKYNMGGTWESENSTGSQSLNPPVLASSREDYYGPDDDYLFIVYGRLYDNRIAYKKFFPGSNVFGPERLAGQSDQSPSTLTSPGASFFRDRLHIAARGSENTIWYMSCTAPCVLSSTWTRFVEQDPGAQGGLALENYGAYDGYLYLWHRLASSNYLVRRDKLSK